MPRPRPPRTIGIVALVLLLVSGLCASRLPTQRATFSPPHFEVSPDGGSAAPELPQAAPTDTPPSGRRSASATSPASLGLVDVNTAGASELERLPGIGPALAQRILGFRQERGPFRKLEDLLEVGGIGPRKLERLRARLAPIR